MKAGSIDRTNITSSTAHSTDVTTITILGSESTLWPPSPRDPKQCLMTRHCSLDGQGFHRNLGFKHSPLPRGTMVNQVISSCYKLTCKERRYERCDLPYWHTFRHKPSQYFPHLLWCNNSSLFEFRFLWEIKGVSEIFTVSRNTAHWPDRAAIFNECSIDYLESYSFFKQHQETLIPWCM